MTQRDMAELLSISPMTLRNWRKEKPYLYEIVMKGFAFNEIVEKAQQNADEIRELKEKFELEK